MFSCNWIVDLVTLAIIRVLCGLGQNRMIQMVFTKCQHKSLLLRSSSIKSEKKLVIISGVRNWNYFMRFLYQENQFRNFRLLKQTKTTLPTFLQQFQNLT